MPNILINTSTNICKHTQVSANVLNIKGLNSAIKGHGLGKLS